MLCSHPPHPLSSSTTGTYLWCAAAIDLAISSTLVFQIRSLKSGASTDSLLSTIATTAMKAAVPTTIFAVIGALMATIFPPAQISTVNAVFAFNLPLPSLYTISFIYTLSSRQSIAPPPSKREEGSGDASSYPLNGFPGLGVEVQHEVVVRTEVDLDGLLFRNRTSESAPARTAGPPAPGTKWDRERDCADW